MLDSSELDGLSCDPTTASRAFFPRDPTATAAPFTAVAALFPAVIVVVTALLAPVHNLPQKDLFVPEVSETVAGEEFVVVWGGGFGKGEMFAFVCGAEVLA